MAVTYLQDVGMKQALMKVSGRLAAVKASAVAITLFAVAFFVVDDFALWVELLLASLVVLGLIVFWIYRSELNSIRLDLTSKNKSLRDSDRSTRRLFNNDVLTGLPNRTRFRDSLAGKLGQARDQERHLAIGILYLNNLETIQDILDDDAGDELIVQFTDILTSEFSHYQGYFGSGQFAFMLDEVQDRKTAFSQMLRVIKTVSRDIVVADLPIRLQVIGGVAICPGDADSATGLIQKAKLAMTNAKKTGAQLLFYNNSMAPDLQKIQLISDLKTTLSENKLMWALQPQYDVQTKRIAGAELLVRWRHPQYGWIPPADFVVWAEQVAVVGLITDAAVDQACRIIQHMKNHKGEFGLSVNLSSNDLADSAKVDHIISCCANFAGFLTLEITETALMKDMDAVVLNVSKLKLAGIRLSLDDYGTGFSSLEYLQTFIFDEIKIDKMFTSDLAQNDRNQTLTLASIELAHSLGAKAVAEGVEDKESADMLIAMGCDVLQGYYIGKPIVVTDIKDHLDAYERLSPPG
ncbi:MAG: EAL domain-containing protein [Pseudohongiella sp.]|nr:EAL domain-containing protein [Pseudohongiella sp.]